MSPLLVNLSIALQTFVLLFPFQMGGASSYSTQFLSHSSPRGPPPGMVSSRPGLPPTSTGLYPSHPAQTQKMSQHGGYPGGQQGLKRSFHSEVRGGIFTYCMPFHTFDCIVAPPLCVLLHVNSNVMKYIFKVYYSSPSIFPGFPHAAVWFWGHVRVSYPAFAVPHWPTAAMRSFTFLSIQSDASHGPVPLWISQSSTVPPWSLSAQSSTVL